jgi:hypothetical protein
MKRLAGTLGKHIEAVDLSRHDLEHIENLLRKVSASVKYKYDDFEFDNIDELTGRHPEDVRKLEVCSSDPYISVNFGTRNVWLYTSSHDLAARGVYAELWHFLEDKCIRAVVIRKGILEMLGGIGVFVGTLLLLEQQFLAAALAWAVAPITFAFKLYYPSRSRIMMSNSRQGFWVRNLDNLLIGILASALVSGVFFVIQLAFSNGKG